MSSARMAERVEMWAPGSGCVQRVLRTTWGYGCHLFSHTAATTLIPTQTHTR